MISYLLCVKLFWDAMSKGSSKLSVVKVFWIHKKKLPKCSCLEIVLVVYLTQHELISFQMKMNSNWNRNVKIFC